MDKHERPYKCLEKSCHNKTFSDKAGLRRHHRSVHSKPLFICPTASCRRHINGFARKDNLLEHQKRAHLTSSLAMNPHLIKNHSLPLESDVTNAEGVDGSVQSGINRNDIIELPVEATTVAPIDAQSLVAKLQELKEERARRLEALDLKSLDEDIMAMERTLAICSSTIPYMF